MNPENINPNETTEFLWRRLSEDCPNWAIGVPVLFAFLVVGLIVLFRQERKLKAAAIGGAIVGVFSIIYLFLGFFLVQFFSWLVILIPVMGVALFYVGLMYFRDAKSVHWLWAIFLGLLRTTVYLILAVVFLLPGCQHMEKQDYESKVIFVFDVSGSMMVVDEIPELGQDPAKLPSRQDLIAKFLAGAVDADGRDKTPFIDRVIAKSPVTMYRFGPILDETDIVNLHARTDKIYTIADANKWLKPDKKDVPRPDVANLSADEAKEKLTQYTRRQDLMDTLKSGTNIGGSLLQLHKIENNSYVQAIVVVSDGQSNLGSDDARTDFLNRVTNPKRPIPVITIGVGQFRMPASIRIDDIQAPEETRPDDKFKIRIPVVSTGLRGQEFTLSVELTRKKDVTGKEIQDKTFTLPDKIGKFEGPGDQQQGVIEYEIDVQDLKGIKADKDKNGDLEGEWHIVAKTPRHAKEPFPDPFHVTDPIKVQIQKRALRVLLFAGGATREYQFLRSVLYREMIEKRMEMCIFLQTGRADHIDQDVEPERLLADFPDKLGPDDPGRKFMSLSDYDVVVAFDPDWSRLNANQLRVLNEWVGTHSGGVIFVAGPLFSYQLARAGGRDFSALMSIYPVVVKDNRLHGLEVVGAGGHDATRPYALNFNPVPKDFDFLKLDDASDSPIAGWKGFFWNDEKFPDNLGKDTKPRRGFFTYYPVERLKTSSAVAATFAGPKDSRIGDKTDDFKDQQPFIVTMPFGSGKTMYVGSGELWRLRAYQDGFHERLWIKMARHVAAGATQQKKYGRILMARNLPVGLVNFEAQIKGKDLLPLPMDERPTVTVRRIDKDRPLDSPDPLKDKNKKEVKAPPSNLMTFELQAKPADGSWQGYFTGSIQIKEPGEYEFSLPIKNLPSESLRQSLIIRKPNPELDNVRTNFAYLYQLSSEVKDLRRVAPETRKEIEKLVQVPVDQGSAGTESVMTKRLFFPLSSADAVDKCLVQVPPKSDIIKGRFEDLWDGGLVTDRFVHTYWAALLTPLAIGVIGVVILLILRQWVSALAFFGICAAMSLAVALTDLVFSSLLTDTLDMNFSYLLLLIVGLLGIEWLARKLLRLA